MEQEIIVEKENIEQEIELENENLAIGILPYGTLDITENGTYDVTNYADVDVETPGIIPEGTINILTNGEHDIYSYANAHVQVPSEKYAPRYISFYGSPTYDLIDEISNLSLKNTNTMANMFNSCNNIINLDLSSLDMSNIENMQSTFASCYNLKTINFPITTFTKNVNLNRCFNGCAMQVIDLRNLHFLKIVDTSNCFGSCQYLKEIKFPETFDISANGNTGAFAYMFSNCYALETVDFSSFVLGSHQTSMFSLFNSCRALKSVDFTTLRNPPEFVNAGNAFWNCYALEFLNISNIDLTKITSYSGMFGTNSGTGPADDCLIIVGTNADKQWLNEKFSRLTNVKTVEEYEGE